MTYTICRECETQAWCCRNGCIPITRNLDELEDIVIRMERGKATPLTEFFGPYVDVMTYWKKRSDFPVIDPTLIPEVE